MTSWSVPPSSPSFNARSATAEVGVLIASVARGRGIVTRAVAAMLDWAFTERGVHRVEWKCAPGNEPSRRMAQRLGFTHEGTLREAFPVRDERQDLEVWALLAPSGTGCRRVRRSLLAEVECCPPPPARVVHRVPVGFWRPPQPPPGGLPGPGAKNLTGSRKGGRVAVMDDETTDAEFEHLLRGADLRVTRPRLAVLRAVRRQPHADTGSVLTAVRGEEPTVSHQAVYDVLGALTDAGLVRRIQPAGSVARYELRVGDNHHHVVCRSCGAVADVDCAVGHTPCLVASDSHGFVVDEAEVTYWGTCPDCSSTRTSSPA